MKPLRILLVGLALACSAAAGLVILALTPRFQTWAAHRMLASRPQWKTSVGRVSASLAEVDLTDVRVEHAGGVLVIPSLRAEFPLVNALFRKRYGVRRIAASGWTLDVSRMQPRGRVSEFVTARSRIKVREQTPSFIASARADAPTPAGSLVSVFEGLFPRLHLPADLQVDAVDLQGDVILSPARGMSAVRVHVGIAGGGIGAGQEGQFSFSLRSAPAMAGPSASTVTADGSLAATMDTPRTFSRLRVAVEASAAGGKFSSGAKLSANLEAARIADGESYELSLASEQKRLASARANLSDGTHALSGSWSLDISDDDLAPFTLGRPLPVFSAAGDGSFDTDAAMTRLHASGRLSATAERLGVFRSGLDSLGAVSLTAEFDIAHRGGELRVDRLTAALAGVQPIAEVHVLQPFAFNLASGELKVANPERDLLGIALEDVPATWAQPLLSFLEVTSGSLHGNLVASARAGGLGLRSPEPLALTGLSATRGGRPALELVDVSMGLSADYAPEGWQIEIARLSARRGAVPVFTGEGRIGRLSGARQPIKAAGRMDGDLALLAEPLFGPGLARGRFSGEFTASVGTQRSYRARLKFLDLSLADAGDGASHPSLPSVSGEIGADSGPDGRWSLIAPLTFAGDDRVSDLTLAGTLAPTAAGWSLDARLTSAQIFADDLRLLAGAFSLGGDVPQANPTQPDAVPASWAMGLTGRLVLGLKRIRLAESDLSDVQGVLRFAPAEVGIEGIKLKLGTGGTIDVSGALVRSAGPAPYALEARIAVGDFDYGAYYRSGHPGRTPAVDGKFRFTGRIAGKSDSLAGLAETAQGDFQIASKGGVFRALRADVADSLKQSPALISQALDSFGSLFGIKADKADEAKRILDKQGKMVVALAERLREVPYDQVNVAVSRGADLDIRCTEFALIAPEMRLGGTGRIAYVKGRAIGDQPLTFDGRLGARGRLADSLSGIGLLGGDRDDLGYAGMSQPVHLGGSLDDIDESQWEELLVKSALHKATGGLLDKLLGK